MSDDPTKRFDEVKNTAPTLETILLRINKIGEELHTFRTEINVRLDRAESLAHQTRSEMLAMRADFTELREQLREGLPSLVK